MRTFSTKLKLFLLAMMLSATTTAIYSPSASSQPTGWTLFKKFPQSNNSKKATINQFGKLMYFPNIRNQEFRILDFYGSEVVWTPFSLGLDYNASVCFSSFEKPIQKMDWTGNTIIYYPAIRNYGWLYKVTNINNNQPVMSEAISSFEFFGINNDAPGDCINPAAVQYTVMPGMGEVWCYIDTDWNGGNGSLKFSLDKKPDSVIAEFKFPTYSGIDNTGFAILKMGALSDIMFNMIGRELFFEVSHPDNTIIKFDGYAKEFTRYEISKDLPLEFDTLPNSTEIIYSTYGSNEILINKTLNCWMISIKQIDTINTTNVYRAVLLTYTTADGFKSIQMSPSNVAKYKNDDDIFVRSFGRFNDSTIYFTYSSLSPSNSEIITYNVITGKYGSICIPLDWLDTDNYIINDVKMLEHSDNYPVVGILLNTGHFLFYDPTVGIEEPSIITKLQVAPNLTSATSTLTLDLETQGSLIITLNDLLGQELSELHNAFTDAGTFTKTFSIADLPIGIYYLKIFHNGNLKVEKVIKN